MYKRCLAFLIFLVLVSSVALSGFVTAFAQETESTYQEILTPNSENDVSPDFYESIDPTAALTPEPTVDTSQPSEADASDTAEQSEPEITPAPAAENPAPEESSAPETTEEPIMAPSPQPIEEATATPEIITTEQPIASDEPEAAFPAEGYAFVRQNRTPVYQKLNRTDSLLAYINRNDAVFVSERIGMDTTSAEDDWLLCHFDTTEGVQKGYIAQRYLAFCNEAESETLLQQIRAAGVTGQFESHPLMLVQCEWHEVDAGFTEPIDLVVTPEPEPITDVSSTPEAPALNGTPELNNVASPLPEIEATQEPIQATVIPTACTEPVATLEQSAAPEPAATTEEPLPVEDASPLLTDGFDYTSSEVIPTASIEPVAAPEQSAAPEPAAATEEPLPDEGTTSLTTDGYGYTSEVVIPTASIEPVAAPEQSAVPEPAITTLEMIPEEGIGAQDATPLLPDGFNYHSTGVGILGNVVNASLLIASIQHGEIAGEAQLESGDIVSVLGSVLSGGNTVYYYISFQDSNGFIREGDVAVQLPQGSSENLLNSGNWQYFINTEGYATIAGYIDTQVVSLTIPDQLDNIRVSAIGQRAFAANACLETIKIHGNVLYIADDAFEGLQSIKIMALNGAPAQSYAQQKNYSFVSLSKLDFFPGVVDYSDISAGRFAFSNSCALTMDKLEARRLSVGTLFFIPASYQDTMASALQVLSISYTGDTAKIQAAAVSIFDIVNELNFSGTNVPVDLGGGNTHAESYDVIDEADTVPFPDTKPYPVLGGKLGTVTLKNPTITYDVKVVDTLFDGNLPEIEKLYFKFDCDIEHTLSISQKVEQSIKIGTLHVPLDGTPTGWILSLDLDLYINLSVSGEIKITTTAHTDFGIQKTSGGYAGFKDISKPTVTGEMTASVAIGLKFAATLRIVSKVASVAFSLTPELRFDGKLTEDIYGSCLQVDLTFSVLWNLNVKIIGQELYDKGGTLYTNRLASYHFEDGKLVSQCKRGDKTIAFDSRGGTKVPQQTVKWHAKITQPASPAKSGSVFTGWYTDTACTKKWSFSNLVENDMTLYAGWAVSGNAVPIINNDDTGASGPGAQPGNPSAPLYNETVNIPTQENGWSAWSTTPVQATASRQVMTKEVETKYNDTVYTYSRYKYYHLTYDKWYYSYGSLQGDYKKPGSGEWQSIEVDSPLPKREVYHGTYQGKPKDYQSYGNTTVGNYWFWEEAVQKYTHSAFTTYYAYRDIIVPTSLTLSNDQLQLYVTDTYTLRFGILPENAENKKVSFSSSNPAVASVDDNGLITACVMGTSVIKVTTHNGLVKECTVTVMTNKLNGVTITLNKVEAAIQQGKSLTLKATVVASTSAETKAINKKVIWSSSNPAVATVSSKGQVKGIKPGTTLVTATGVGGISFTCVVKVTEVPVSSIRLNKSSASINIGATLTLKATITPSNAWNKTVEWTSSNPSVASVNTGGVVFANALGTATITAKTVNGKEKSCKIIVNPVKATKVTATPTRLLMNAGEIFQAAAVIIPANTTDKTLTWTSSKPLVAVVNNDGTITAKSSGTAIITVKTTNGKKATVRVVVR